MDSWLKDLKVLDVSNGIGGARFAPEASGPVRRRGPESRAPSLRRPRQDPRPLLRRSPPQRRPVAFSSTSTAASAASPLTRTKAAGRRIFQRLADQADVLVESFAPGHLDSLGLGYDALSATNPGLVQISVSDFGQWGPYSAYHRQRSHRECRKRPHVPHRLPGPAARALRRLPPTVHSPAWPGSSLPL